MYCVTPMVMLLLLSMFFLLLSGSSISYLDDQALEYKKIRLLLLITTLLDPRTTSKNGLVIQDLSLSVMDKILEHLPQDQENVTTSSVSSNVFSHPNDVIGKAYGAKHSSRVHGLDIGICSSSIFGTSRHSIGFVNSSRSSQHVENLKKYVQSLEIKLSGYKETKEQLAHTRNRLATLEKFIVEKFDSELTTFAHDVPPS
ncbi:PREDICTED: uncharacterized protein LOC109359584 isoform X2 [Lupinus angustifolius]|nr:PREDICTED: uncharacterized protein LOC109359584 isoform X2 [Lupinus angustifolius]